MSNDGYCVQFTRDLITKFGLTTDNIEDLTYPQLLEEVKALPFTQQFEIWRTCPLSGAEMKNILAGLQFGAVEETMNLVAADLIDAIIGTLLPPSTTAS